MITVVKHGGRKEEFEAAKMNKVAEWACEGLEASPSEILLKAKLQLFDGITTSAIHETLIKSASDLISGEEPDYQYAAARLLLFKLRKEAFGDFTPPGLKDHVERVVALGKYDKEILESFDEDDFEFFDSKINHDLDFDYTYAAMSQWRDKYLVKDRVSGMIYESPQIAIMLVAMCLHSAEKKDRRKHVVDFYEAVSGMRLSLPSPVMAGVRTPTRQFSSCVLIEAGDDIDQIFTATEAQGKYAAQRAGIGLNFGSIRGSGAPIRGGEVKHAGTVPIVRMFQEALGWASQGGMRKASATYFYPMWHWDFEKLIVLKNNRGTEKVRARDVDYGVQISRLFWKRLATPGAEISFFHPNVANGELYKAFFEASQDRFEALYEELEKDPSVPRNTMSALDAFSVLAQERIQTGRIYIQYVDNCNSNSPFDASVAPVKQSNLCVEIALPTSPINNIHDPEDTGEIALCTLSAFNLGKVKTFEDLMDLARVSVRSLDNLLTYQNYPVLAAEKNLKRRTLGIGWTNLAYYLADRGLNYSSGNANNEIHRLAEAFQFALLVASKELAQERGKCELYHETTYSQGVLPIDRYKKSVDKLHTQELLMDWEWLRKEIAEHGLRNSTLSTMMPCETSSQITNSTNGIEPPRGLTPFKGELPQVVPEIDRLRNAYESKWDMPDITGYLNIVALIQKFIDQSLSANTSYKPEDFPGGKLPVKKVLKDMMYAYTLGIKTLYYHDTKDGNEQNEDSVEPIQDEQPEQGPPVGCDSGACAL